MIELLSIFGSNATSIYNNCPEKYMLLGEENFLIVKEKPDCFLNLVPSFCYYYVETNSNRPHPGDLRYFITQTVSKCLKV